MTPDVGSRQPFRLPPGAGTSVWSLGGRFTTKADTTATELGDPADADVPPAGLGMPGPEVLGPVAARYGIEVVGPPRRAL